MSWLVFTMIAIVVRGAFGVSTKTLSRDIPGSPFGHSAILLLGGSVIALFVSPFIGALSTEGIRSELPALSGMILSNSIGNLLYFRGIRRLDASVTQIAFSSIVVWGAALSSTILGSVFSIQQLAGAALLLAAVWLAQYERGVRVNTAVLYIVASAACFALFQVMSADVSEALTAGTYTLIAFAGPTVLTFAFLAVPIRNDFRACKGRRVAALKSAAPASLLSVVYYVAGFFAYREAPDPGVVVLLLTTQVLVGLLLAMLLLGERWHPKRTLAAGAMAVVAAIALKA